MLRRILIAAAVILGVAAVGVNPRYVEEIVIGGGPSETVDGGLEIDKAGALDSTGSLTGASLKLREGSDRATITAPALTANRAVTLPDAAGEISLLGQTISSGEIVDGTVDAVDLAPNSVASSNIINGTIVVADIATGGVATAEILDGTILAEDLSANAVDGSNIVDGSIETADLADNSVTSAKIVNSTIATADLDDGSVTSAKILDATIVTADIATGGVATADILDATIAAADIGTGAVTTTGILDATIAAADLATGAVTSTGILDGTILNADINAAAAIAITKISSSGAAADQVLSYNGAAIVWADAATGTGNVLGPGPAVDNAIPRMDGAGGYQLQAYSTNTPTIDNDGLLDLPGGMTVGGVVTFETGTNLILDDGSLLFYSADVSRLAAYLSGVESGGAGGAGGLNLVWDVHDNSGNLLYRAMTINRLASAGIIIGDGSPARPLYVKGDIYAGTTDLQITSAGVVLMSALDETGADAGEVLGFNGTVWGPTSSGSGNVSNLGAGTDNSVARFDGGATSIQQSQVIIDDSGNVDAAGTVTAGSSNTVLTSAAGVLLDAAMSAQVAHLDVAETVTANWVNTANPWADNEVADTLTIGSGSTMSSPPAIGGVAPAAGGFTTLATTGDITTTTTNTNSYLTLNGGTGSLQVMSQSSVNIRIDSDNNATDQFFRVVPNATSGGTTVFSVSEAGDVIANGSVTHGDAAADSVNYNANTISWEGLTADAFETIFTPADVTADIAVVGPNVAGTMKTRTPIWLSAAALTPTTTAGCTAPSTNATDSWIAPMTASTNGFFQIVIPADYDGSTESVTLWYYKSDTNAVTWSISEVDFADNVADTTTYDAAVTQADTPVANNIQAVTISAATFFDTTANAGKLCKVKIGTNAYTGTTANFMGLKIEY